jgi:hypothetical protein
MALGARYSAQGEGLFSILNNTKHKVHNQQPTTYNLQCNKPPKFRMPMHYH